ncbi:hypothetical protein [Mangrovicoccus sp. HB161399]|uniref:hypothetical protein n=1 Tax=Mangrovicoccus sp. HB161399 TaxID=2720392 RepID=UPI0015574887|nr:hypothetical protein [Mangrovicoccus sp. HB161399]
MTNKFAAIAAIAIAVSGAAATANASDQLARSLGVEAGTYSNAQLVQLRNALEDGDSQKADFILNGQATAAANAGDQLARSLNVEPGAYTTAELVSLKGAIENDDATRVSYVINGREVASRNASADASDSQLARALGASGDHDTATLAAAYLDATGRGDD